MIRKNAVAWTAILMSGLSLGYNFLPRQPLPALAPTATEELKTAKALSKAFNNVAEYVHESVVQIRTEGRRPQAKARSNRPNMPQGPNGQPMTPEQMEELFRRFFREDAPFQFRPNQAQPSPGSGTGSGFVFDEKGHILTNNHVVEDAEKIIVTLHDGDEHIAKLVGRDPQSDIAVIKIEKESVRPLPLGDSESLKVGEMIWVSLASVVTKISFRPMRQLIPAIRAAHWLT
jgi:serine protease Do